MSEHVAKLTCYWFKWFTYMTKDRDIYKGKDFLVQSNSVHEHTNNSDFKFRTPELV